MQTPRDRKIKKFTVILKDDIFKEFKATLGFMNPRKTGDGEAE